MKSAEKCNIAYEAHKFNLKQTRERNKEDELLIFF